MSRWQTFLEESSFLREYLWKYRKLVFFGLLCLTLVNLLDIFPPLLLKKVVDNLIEKPSMEEITQVAILYFGISVFQALGRYGWRAFLVRGSMFTGRDLRGRYAEYLYFLSSSFYDRRRVGDLMSLATNDTEAIRMGVGGGLIIFADAVCFIITIPIAMFILSPKLTMLAFIPLPIIPFIVLRQEREIHSRFKKVQAAFSDLSAMAQESLMGVRVVKAFAREEVIYDRFRKSGEKYIRRSLYLARVQSVFGPDLHFVMSTGIVILLYFGGAGVIEGAVTLGTFVAFQKYIQKIIWPMEAIGFSIAFYQKAVASSHRLKKVLDEEIGTPEPTNPISPHVHNGKIEGRIEIKNLSFQFPRSDRPILKNLSLHIEPGERVAFVGAIGSGKTALLSLIPRIYSVPAGHIFIDGIDINFLSLEDLRQHIGFVSQDPFLFSESVFENVAFGLPQQMDPNQKRERVESATKISLVHEDILHLTQSYDTRLGERGVNLSGGQKQRLTMARALAKEPSILILDDSLSAVDMQTESKILKSLKNRPGKNTELISAHRISTIQDADRIFVLDQGQISQVGKHRELIKIKSGIYFKYYEQQRLKEELDEYERKLEGQT